ncbi:MAG TPA: autotransporter-associated beta strand repeat-containing protein [Chthoniobacterales bacterium]|jgi:autotransporter-associated beta strand protein
MKSPLHLSFYLTLLGLTALFCANTPLARAGSATWQQNPATGNWNTPTNWTPATVPNGSSDVATFASSAQTNVSVTSGITLDSIVFQPDASPFTINTSSEFAIILISGVGVVNNSSFAQNFVVGAIGHDQGALDFSGTATAGNAIYTQGGAAVRGSFGGTTSFFNSSTADTASFFLNGGAANTAAGGGVLFFDTSSAGSAIFTINPGMVRGATGGHLEFVDTSTAGSAIIAANGGTNGAAGGKVFFLDDSTGGRANVVLQSNATLDLTLHNAPGVTLTSVQGDGLVLLGSSTLRINNKLNVAFAGVISDSGVLSKTGQGRLDLTNGNTYTGGTVVRAGTLLADNTTGSATGTGAVSVDSGALGGNGTISGAVTIGSDTPGNGSFLTPGQNLTHPGTITIEKSLTFASDGFLNVALSQGPTAGQVTANGVTIQTGAQFAFFNTRGLPVPVGTVLTLINNTAATPIAGVFDNLPDGLVFTDHGNKFAVNYEGGDGNDLTLTSVQ